MGSLATFSVQRVRYLFCTSIVSVIARSLIDPSFSRGPILSVVKEIEMGHSAYHLSTR